VTHWFARTTETGRPADAPSVGQSSIDIGLVRRSRHRFLSHVSIARYPEQLSHRI